MAPPAVDRAMRLDRLATLYVFQPLAARRTGAGAGIPILMYHSISAEPETGHPYFHTRTSPERFAAQIYFLRENGYSTVPLVDVPDLLAGGRREIRKPLVITFDDGYRNFYTHAGPILAESGFTATVFLPTGFLGNPRKQLHRLDCMTWDEVRELDRAGIEFGSHTVTHPKLVELQRAQVERELRDSQKMLEDELGKAVRAFAYPYAFPETARSFLEFLKDTLIRCNYRVGVTTMIGTATADDDRLFLRRLPVNSADDDALLQAKLDGGYDWLYGLQRLKKSLRRGAAV